MHFEVVVAVEGSSADCSAMSHKHCNKAVVRKGIDTYFHRVEIDFDT